MTLPRRIAELFVMPPGERSAPAAATQHAPAADDHTPAAGGRMPAAAERGLAVALLAAPAEAPALAAALALALARARRAPTAVVCVWSTAHARPSWRAPARPAAARLAASLAGRGHDARAAGRLVTVRLADAVQDAASESLRVSAAAGAAPAVLALAGPRAAAFDVALAGQDLVVLAVPRAADPGLGQLAAAGLDRALVCPLTLAGPARALAAAGLALPPSARRALAAAVAAVP